MSQTILAYQGEKEWAVIPLRIVINVGQAEGKVEGSGNAQQENAKEHHPHACPILVAVTENKILQAHPYFT